MPTGQDRNSLVLATDRRYRLVVDPAFKRISSKIWRYHHDSGGPRQHWMAIVDAPGETAGKIFAAGLRLRASVPMTELGRAHVLTPVTNSHLVCRLLL